jgi:phosphoribulokinase
LGIDNVYPICSDDYHKYNRTQRKEYNITALNPAANYIDILENHLTELREGRAILKPNYNHSTGDFDAPTYVKPTDFVIVEGLLGYHTRVTRQIFDVRVFLDPPEDLRKEWKIARDTTKRGYTREGVLQSISDREEDSEAFIRPQKKYADIIIQFYPDEGSISTDKLNAKILLSPTAPCDEFNQIIKEISEKDYSCSDKLGKPCVSINLQKVYGKAFEVLDINSEISQDETEKLKQRIAKSIETKSNKVKVNLNGVGVLHKNGKEIVSFPLALAQLTMAYFMIHALEM